MLKIALLCGGSGGIALQTGFAEIFGYGNYKLDPIINCYDDGKSTGVCRSVFNRQILGPSDLRKNQITQFKLKYKKQLEDADSKESKLLALFELRFTGDNYDDYYKKSLGIVNSIDYLDDDVKKQFKSWINYFFFDNNEVREIIKDVNFSDFSLSNIFYAACAAMHNNSLEEAGFIMSDVFGIEKRVHMISDVNLFINATTQSGRVIIDEGELVKWNNADDKIVKVDLVDSDGNKYVPSVCENSRDNVEEVIRDADILIYSSGTQWSSLIPSYMHDGFNELIASSKAKKYLIMNNAEDGDAYGVDANGVLDILKNYIKLDDVTVVVNDNACIGMNHIDSSYKQIHGELSARNDKKHNPVELVKLIMKDYYELEDKEYQLVSDLDGTLWDSKLDNKDICVENFKLFKGIILSGNNYKHVYDIVKDNYQLDNYVYCNYGNTYFKLSNPSEDNILTKDYSIEDDILIELKKYDEFKDKLTIRGDAVLTIRPLQDRPEKLKIVNKILDSLNNKYQAVVAGHTTIDVMRKEFSKAKTFEIIAKKENFVKSNVIYLGDEYIAGNDTCMLKLNIKNIPVEDVYDTYAFLAVFYKC